MSVSEFLNILLLIILIYSFPCDCMNIHFDSYLSIRQEDTQGKLIENFQEYFRRQPDVRTVVTYHDVHNFYLPCEPIYFEMYNVTFVLLQDQIFTLILKHNSFVLEQHSKLPEIEYEPLFIKSIDVEDITLAVVVLSNNNIQIYKYEREIWTFVQNIRKINFVIDAVLYHHNGHTYLLIVNNVNNGFEPSTLYMWTDEEFTEIDTILTPTATAVTSFKHNHSQIIIITQNPSDFIAAGTYVLYMSSNKMRKIQFLSNSSPEKVVTYYLHNELYAIVFNKDLNCTVYWWDRNYFMRWINFVRPKHVQQISLTYIANRPFLFIVTKKSLTVYQIHMEHIQEISTLPFENYYRKISKLSIIFLNNQIYICFVGFGSNYQREVIYISFSIYIERDESRIYSKYMLVKCLSNLNKKLDFHGKQLAVLKKKSENILQTNQPTKYPGKIKIHDTVTFKNSTINNIYTAAQYKTTEKLVTGPLVITGNLIVENLTVNSVYTSKLYKKDWISFRWLSKTKNQTIPRVYVRNITSNKITVYGQRSYLNDLLFVENNDKFLGSYTFNSVKAKNLFVTNINNIPFETMHKRHNLTTITGRKYFQNISAKNIQAEISSQEVHDLMYSFQQNCIVYDFSSVRHLNVTRFNFEIINGIIWQNFFNLLFLKNTDNSVSGTINIYSKVKIKNLITKILENRNVDLLFTTSTNQNISSDIWLKNINVENIISSNINGISFKENVVTFNDTHFAGPVSIKNIHVLGNITAPTFPENKLHETEGNILQIYSGHVKIMGNLKINNVSLHRKAKMFHGNKLFELKNLRKYWSKSKNQTISVNVRALNGLSVKHLNTKRINNIFLVPMSNNNNAATIYTFKNVVVMGNFVTNSLETFDPSAIDNILKNAVRKTGRYRISGHKTFKNSLHVSSLETEVLNNIAFSEIAQSKKSNKFTGFKTFHTLVVEDEIVLPKMYKLKIKTVNGYPLLDLLNRSVYINAPSYINHLHIKNVTGKNVIFENIFKNDVNEIIQKLMNLFTMDVLNNVYVHQNVTADIIQNIKFVNGVAFEDYISKLAFTNKKMHIKNEIVFEDAVNIKSLHTQKLNDVSLHEIPEKYLSYRKKQKITAQYEFDTLKSPSLNAPAVNNIDTNHLLSKNSDRNIDIYTNINMSSLDVKESVNSNHFSIDLQRATDGISNVSGRYWSQVIVLNNIYVSDIYGNIGRLLKHAVSKLFKSNIIRKEVHFHHITAKKIDLIQSKINGVNMTEIYNDALKTKGEDQLILGSKTFRKLSAASIKVYGNALIETINGINVLELNNTLIHKKNLRNSPVRGHKTFTKNLKIKNLKYPHKIHGVLPENLYSMNRESPNLLNVHFKHVNIINECNVTYVNDVDIPQLLRDRMLRATDSPQKIYANLTFTNVELSGNSNTVSINNVYINTVIVDRDSQYISGAKHFFHPVTVSGNMNVKHLNKHNFSKEYEKSLLLGNDVFLDSQLVFTKPTKVRANIESSNINGYSIADLLSILDTKQQITSTVSVITDLDRIIYEYLQRVSGDSVFLSLVELRNNAKLMKERYKISCFMTETIATHQPELHSLQSCQSSNNDCYTNEWPVPYTDWEREMALYTMNNNDLYRIFTLYKDGWIVHVFMYKNENTSDCRSNETYVTWSKASKSKASTPHVHVQPLPEPVYLNIIEFLLFNDNIFVLLFTEELCQIIKLSEHQNQVNVIQTIPITGASKLELFETAYGIIMIISGYKHDFETNIKYTLIYKFNQQNEQFMLLQKIQNAKPIVILPPYNNMVLLQTNQYEIATFQYESLKDKYLLHHNLYIDTSILHAFTIKESYNSEMLVVVSTNGQYHIFSFNHIEGWKLITSGSISNLQALSNMRDQHYFIAHTSEGNKFFSVIKQGSN